MLDIAEQHDPVMRMICYQIESIEYFFGLRWYVDPAPVQFPLDSYVQVCDDECCRSVLHEERGFARDRRDCERHRLYQDILDI